MKEKVKKEGRNGRKTVKEGGRNKETERNKREKEGHEKREDFMEGWRRGGMEEGEKW